MIFKALSHRKEFSFLIRFLILYFSGTFVLKAFHKSYSEISRLDPVTTVCTFYTGDFIKLFGFGPSYVLRDPHPDNELSLSHSIYVDDQYAISIFPGCNGLSLVVLYAYFILSIGSPWALKFKALLLGVPMVFYANALRLALLCLLNTHGQRAHFYFYHKYFFTAIIYAVVLLMWLLFLRLNGSK